MKKKMAKTLAVLMCLMTAVAFMPTWAFAAESDEEQGDQVISQEVEQPAEAIEQEAEEPAVDEEPVVKMKPLSTAAKSQVMYFTLYDGGSVAADKNNKLMLNRKITVSDLNKNGKLSYAEALTAAHAAYCKGGKKGLEVDDSGWVKKLWGKETMDTFFLTNGEVNQDSAEHEVKKGDRLVAGFYIEPSENGYMDVMTSFDKDSASVPANHDLKLKMTYSGLMDYFNPTKNASISSEDEDIVFGYLKDNGSFEPVDAEIDDDGYVTLSFPKTGTYRLTCQGIAGDEAYVIGAPDVCTVTVTAAPSAKIKLTVNKKGIIAKTKKGKMAYNLKVTVKDRNKDGVLSVSEALYAAHKAYNSKKGYAVKKGAVTKLWGVKTGNVLFFVNGNSLMHGVTKDTIDEGDTLYASINKDSQGLDLYTKFSKSEVTAAPFEKIELELTGSKCWPFVMEPVKNVQIGKWKKGKFVEFEGNVVDSEGKVVLSFSKEGTYYVTAKGKVDSEDWNNVPIKAPIMAPVCKITIK